MRLNIVDAEADLFVAQALFATITNVNFEPVYFAGVVTRAISLRDRLAAQLKAAGKLPETLLPVATWQPQEASVEALIKQGMLVGFMSNANSAIHEDLRSLKELLLYGIKGLATYTDHAYVLDYQDGALLAILQEALDIIGNPNASAAVTVGIMLRWKTSLDISKKSIYGMSKTLLLKKLDN